jgi:hypothetical protein
MKRVYTADNRALAWHIKNILQSNSIEAEVRNDTLHSAQGGIPVNECYPEVWVINEADELPAAKLIEEQQNSDQAIQKPQWNCSNCGEQNFGQFEICWNCQSECSESD